MSWAKEEWKQELSANARQNVYDLEQRCEMFQKEGKQKQFQIDSLQAATAKQKKLTEDEKANASSLKKENHLLSESIQELERNRQKYLHDLNAKEGQIRCLDGKLTRCQQMLDAETSSGLQLKNDLDRLQHDQNQLASKFEKQAADLSKAKEGNNLFQRQLAGHKERVRALENQLKSLGEEPNSRAKKSSSGSDSEVEWQSGQESKLKEVEASLQLEREQRKQIEKQLCELRANSAKVNTEESLPSTSEIKDPTFELQLQSKITEVATANEKLSAKDSELQQKIKELCDMSERLQKKENELSEMTLKLTEMSKIKSQLDEANTNVDALEKRAKQRELDMKCQRHNSEAVIKGMDEKLKEKEKEHRQEMHSQSQAIAALEKQCADLEKKSSILQNKLDNSQKMIEAKEHDIARMKASLGEVESTSKQQSCELDSRCTELEQKAKEQRDECVKMKQELDEAKRTLMEKESKITDLNRSIEQLSHTIKEKEKDLSLKEKDIQESQGEDNKKLASALENVSLLQKQKVNMETESQKALQQISDEATAMAKELEHERQDVAKLKERVVYLENVVAGKEKESQKSEDSYKTMCEKLQAAEVDLANNKVEWAKEKTILEEKERSLQGALNAMKNDSKAMQHDYKKACELADMKSAETSDVIDKLESSQKHGRELQQRLSRTEASLKEKESSVSLLMHEKERSMKEQQLKEEEAQKKSEELGQLCTDRKTEIKRLKEVLESANLKLDASRTECTEKENEMGILSTKLGNLESQYNELQNSLQMFEENSSNGQDMLMKKDVQMQEISMELEEKEKVLFELQQQHKENLARLNELEKTCSTLEIQKDEHLKGIRSKDDEIASLVKGRNEIEGVTDKKLAEMNEHCNAAQNEVVFLQENLANLKTLLQNKETEVTEIQQELKSSKEELTTLQQHLVSQEELATESGKENAKLVSDLEQINVVLKATKAELEEVSVELRKLQSEHQSVAEDNGLELEQLRKEEGSLKERLQQANTVAESKAEELKSITAQLEATEVERVELSSMLDELCNTNFKLEDQLAQKTTQLEQVSEVIKTKDEELSNQCKIITNLEKAKDEEAGGIKEQCTLLESQLSSLQEKCTQLDACIQNKNSEISSATAKIKELTDELHSLQDELLSKGELIEGIEKEKETLMENIQYKTAALEDKEREFKEVSESYMKFKTNGQSAHEMTLTELETFKKEVACITEKLNQSVVAIEMKDQELESTSKKLQIAEVEKTNLGVQAEELHDKNAALEEKITELQNRAEQCAVAINMKDQELESIHKKLQIVEEEKSNIGAHAEELHNKNEVLTENVAELKNSAERSALAINMKDQGLEGIHKKLQMVEEEKCNLGVQAEELHHKNEAQTEKIAELQDRLEKSAVAINTKDEELEGMYMKLQIVEEEIRNLGVQAEEQHHKNAAQIEAITELQNSMEQMSNVLKSKEEELSTKCCKLDEMEVSGDKQMTELEGKCSAQKNKIIILEEKCVQLEACVESKNADLGKSTAVEVELSAKLCTLQEMIAVKQESMKCVEEDLNSMKQKFEQQLVALQDKKTKLKDISAGLEEEKCKGHKAVLYYEKEVDKLNNEAVLLREKLEKLNVAVEMKDQDVESMCEQIEAAVEEKNALGSRLDELTMQCKGLEEKNVQMAFSMEQLSNILKGKDEELAEKSQEIEELHKKESGEKMSKLQEMAELKEQDMLQLQEKCSQLKACVDNKESELNDLRGKVEVSENTAEVQVSSLTEKLANKEFELKNKEYTEQELMSKLANKENQLEDANKMVFQLSEDMRQLAAQKEMLQMDLEDKDSLIGSLSKKVELLEGAVLELKKNISEKDESNDSLRKELATLTSQLTESLSNEEKKGSSAEQLQQNIQTLEAQLLAETKKSGTVSEQLQDVQAKLDNTLVRLEEQVGQLQELRENKLANEEKVSKLLNQLDDLEKTLTTAQSDRHEMEQLLRTAEMKHEENNMEMKKERESAAFEGSQLLREKSEECFSALEQLEKSKEEIERLKDAIVHLENISTSKDQEKMKVERSYEAFSEKTQKREEELLRACKDLEDEKSSLLEKTRDCQAAMEALKHECKVYQQDCRKACELADAKAQDYRDVVDKLDDSQKHFQETRQQLSRAETALKDTKEEVQQVRQEKTELSEQMSQKEEELKARIETLRCEICASQGNMSQLSSQLECSEAMVRATETEKHEVEEMLKHAKEELSNAEEKLKAFAGDSDEREVMVRNKEESEKIISLLQEQMQSLEASKSELKSELDNTKKELSQLNDTFNSMDAQHKSAMALKDSELDQKKEIMKEKEQHAENVLEKLQRKIDSCEAKARETENKIAELLSQKQELSSMVDMKAAEVKQLTEEYSELEHACGELKRVNESIEDRLVTQTSELAEMSSEKRRLEEEMSAVKMELELTKKHSVDHMKRSEEDQGQKDKDLEKLQNLLTARCSQVEKLQRNLSEQTEKLESLKNQVSSLSAELDTLKAEHDQCQQKEGGSRNLQEQILELEHLLLREKSNTDTMMHAFQEQEEQWEKEKAKILLSLKNGSENTDSLIAEENIQLKRKLDEMQKDISDKEQEHTKMLQQTERRASSTANVKLDLQAKIRALESQCEELKYNLKQKDEEVFVKEECLKQRNLEVSSLEAKYVAAEEVERELRHHLGEVTQQLEWSKDNKSETVPESSSEKGADQEEIKKALKTAEKELAVLRAEKQDRDQLLEDERQKIVEAAKGFALQQEQTFSKKIENLQQKLARKDEDLQEMDSIVQQLRHDLKTVQQEKNVLLEAADERDIEFDAEKQLWNSGSYSYKKIQQYISDLEEERQNVSQLQEKCNGLERRLKELEHVNSSLQKNLGEIQKETKIDNQEREVREDGLYSKVDLLHSESSRLKEELQSKDSLIASLTDEKEKLLITVASLEEKVRVSAQAMKELQQQCDLTREQLESLKTEKGILEEEKDTSVMQKSQEKIHLEMAVKKVRELEDKLEGGVKGKNELSNTMKEIEGMLEEQTKCLEEKCKELAEMKTILKLADKDNEDSVKEKETKLVELTFAYEDLMNKFNNEGKKLEEKCKELEQVEKQLKQAQEKSGEMKEDFERELDRMKFDLHDSNRDCSLLRDENKDLKQNSTGGADQFEWTREKKKLLHQLEESKLRINQAKRSQEKIQGELSQANLKLIYLESKRNSTGGGAEEIKRLKTQVSELNNGIQKWKAKADNEKTARDNITRKEEEINGLRSEVCKLQEEVKEWKAVADEKKKAAEKTLATNVKLVNKLEKLHREKDSVSPSTGNAAVGNSAHGLLSPLKPSRVNLPQAVSNTGILLSPLAKSLSNLDIKSQPVSTALVTTQVTSTITAENTQLRAVHPNESGAIHEGRDTKVQGMTTRRGIPKPSGTESKKRAGQQATDGSLAKRCRVKSGGEAADLPSDQQLPEGMPEVVSKGFASIPAPPIKSPFIIRRTTTSNGVKTRSAAKRTLQGATAPNNTVTSTKVRTENPQSTRVPTRGQFAPPEMALSPRKTNTLNVPQGPKSKIPKPGRSQVPRPNPRMPAPSTKQAKHRRVMAPGPGEEAPKPTGDQQECKMQ